MNQKPLKLHSEYNEQNWCIKKLKTYFVLDIVVMKKQKVLNYIYSTKIWKIETKSKKSQFFLKAGQRHCWQRKKALLNGMDYNYILLLYIVLTNAWMKNWFHNDEMRCLNKLGCYRWTNQHPNHNKQNVTTIFPSNNWLVTQKKNITWKKKAILHIAQVTKTDQTK